jgi:hypothetical protein
MFRRSGIDRFNLFGHCMRRAKGALTPESGLSLFQKFCGRQLLQLQEVVVERV